MSYGISHVMMAILMDGNRNLGNKGKLIGLKLPMIVVHPINDGRRVLQSTMDVVCSFLAFRDDSRNVFLTSMRITSHEKMFVVCTITSLFTACFL